MMSPDESNVFLESLGLSKSLNLKDKNLVLHPKDQNPTLYPKSKNSFIEENLTVDLSEKWKLDSKNIGEEEEESAADCKSIKSSTTPETSHKTFSREHPVLNRSLSTPSFRIPNLLLKSNNLGSPSIFETNSRRSLLSSADNDIEEKSPRMPSSWKSFSYNVNKNAPSRGGISPQKSSPKINEISSGAKTSRSSKFTK